MVVLNDLGRFQVTLQGKCYTQEMMQEDEFSPASFIKGHKIVFRPDKELKNDISAALSIKRISSEVMA
ncbi:MAG: hypothetical protein IJ290_05420 [Bacteroidaceae bacterium]|nr:hypothetical protein [Bacteroidaceae bacterium]